MTSSQFNRFNAIPINISMAYLTEIDKNSHLKKIKV